jgi:prepilin-type N-terminal cleavage/methylation domain-containing protein
MSSSLLNKQGVTLIESVIAILLVSVGLVGLLSMQPSAWRVSARTDYLGRAAMMLSKELTTRELRIMNPCITPVALGTDDRTLYTSDHTTAQPGDIGFRVQTTTASIGTNVWRVTVTVSWPLNATGIRESIIVTRQDPFRFPGGCL